MLYLLSALLAFGTVNHIYVSFFSTHTFDRYFSEKDDPNQEFKSPFDSFYRLHKYSFLYTLGINRPKVSKLTSFFQLQPCLHMGQLRPSSSGKILQNRPTLITRPL